MPTSPDVALKSANFKYDLFISYRRKDGLPFANWVREKLVTYRLPLALGERSKARLRVYQDTAYERATEDFWESTVLPALRASRYLGVVVTPWALEPRTDGHANWVEREIAAFTATPQGSNVFVLRGIATKNELLPGGLSEKFPHIEQVDISDVQPVWKKWRKRGLLRDRVLSVAATLYDVPPEKMPVLRQEEERRKRRTAWAVAFVSLILLGIVSALAFAWLRQRNVARQERNIAVARQLAAQASLVLKDNPGDVERSVLLAVESMRLSPLFENDAAVREGLRLFLKPVAIEDKRNFRAVAFGPDSQFAAVTFGDKVVRIVELPDGKELLRMDHPDSVLSVTLSPDGQYLATFSADTNLRIFDVKTGAMLSQASGLGHVTAITFSPDSRYLSSGGEDKSVRIFESRTWKQVLQLDYERPVKAVTYTQDGNYLLSRTGELVNIGEVDSWRIFDIRARKNISLLMSANYFDSLSFGPNGRFMIYAKLFDARREKRAGDQIGGQLRAAALSPDGNFITACGGLASITKTCSIYSSAAPFERLRELPAHRDVVVAITYSPDGHHVATTSTGIIRVFETATGTEVGDIPNQDIESAVVFSAGSRYLVTGVGSEHLQVYSLAADVILHLPNRGRTHPVSFSADGRYVAYAGRVQVFEMQSGRELLPKANLGQAVAVALSPDGGYLALNSPGRPAQVVSLVTGKSVGLGMGGGVPVLAFSMEGKLLATGSSSVEVFRLSDGSKVFGRTDLGTLRSLTFSPDARYLAVGGSEGASVFDLRSGERILQVTHARPGGSPGGQYIVHSVAFSPDGRYFASGSLDKIVPIYEMTSRREVHQIIHQETIFAITFSRDSKYIATGGADKTARVFEISSEREVARLSLTGAVRALVFSSDKPPRYLMTATGDGDAVVTRQLLLSDDLISEACARLSRNLTREEEWKQYLGENESYRKTCPKLQ